MVVGRKLNVIKKTAVITSAIIFMTLLAAIASDSGIAGGIDPAAEFSNITAEDISSKLIRLHVIAHSDLPEDQELKMRVRDIIVEALNSKLEKVDDIETSREIIKANLGYIENIARQQILKSGKDYSVKAMMGKFPFPVKSYGYVTLPAGEYEALRIIIGEGKGANWWCVLFPPLCFVDITHGLTREEAKDNLQRVLTGEELDAIVTAASADEVPVEIRFKVLEWWQTAKGKLNRTIKLAFK
jgi:stage II sporulation protein R